VSNDQQWKPSDLGIIVPASLNETAITTGYNLAVDDSERYMMPIIYAVTALHLTVRQIQTAARGFSTPALRDELSKMPGKLGQLLTEAILAYNDYGLSLADNSPAMLLYVEELITMIHKFVREPGKRRRDLERLCRRDEDPPRFRVAAGKTAEERIGGMLLDYEGTSVKRPQAAQFIVEHLEDKRRDKTITPQEIEALRLIKAWQTNPVNLRKALERCAKRAQGKKAT
jgi:hypothetical protein